MPGGSPTGLFCMDKNEHINTIPEFHAVKTLGSSPYGITYFHKTLVNNGSFSKTSKSSIFVQQNHVIQLLSPVTIEWHNTRLSRANVVDDKYVNVALDAACWNLLLIQGREVRGTILWCASVDVSLFTVHHIHVMYNIWMYIFLHRVYIYVYTLCAFFRPDFLLVYRVRRVLILHIWQQIISGWTMIGLCY